ACSGRPLCSGPAWPRRRSWRAAGPCRRCAARAGARSCPRAPRLPARRRPAQLQPMRPRPIRGETSEPPGERSVRSSYPALSAREVPCVTPLELSAASPPLWKGGRRPDDTRAPTLSGRCQPRSALEDLLLADGNRLAPPTLVARQCDVLPRHPWLAALGVARREEQVVARGEVRGMLAPGRPFITRRAAPTGEQRGETQQHLPAVGAHVGRPPDGVVRT